MLTRFVLLAGLLLISILPAGSQTPAQDASQDRSAELKDLQVRVSPHKGKLRVTGGWKY